MTETKRLKVYNASDISCDEGKREVVSIINTEAIDRDGEVVQPKGLKKKNFQGNPVVFANHNYMDDPNALPCGTCKWIKSGTDANGNDVLIAKTFFTDKTQLGRDVFGLFQDNILNSFSVGFQTLRQSKPSTAEINARPELKNCKNIVREWDLLEYSAVGLPCNPEALSLAVSKGYRHEIIDILSGEKQKQTNTKTITEEIVEELKVMTLPKTESEIKKLICERIDKVVVEINADAIIKAAQRLLIK